MGLFDMKFLMASLVLFVVLSPCFLLHLPLPDEDGKVMKGPDYIKPDLNKFVA